MRTALSKQAFYGDKRRHLQKVQMKLSQKEAELKQEHLPPPYIPRLDSPDANWKVFRKQSDALEFACSRSGDLHVFAFESNSFFEKAGQRLYLVSSYEHFWHYYSRLPDSQRHHYEVIPQEAVCHLYADLEFDKTLNEDRNGEQMVSIFIRLVCPRLRSDFDIECGASQVLILDASTEVKFSCHLVFHLSNAAFRNNIEAGIFMKSVYCQLLSELKDEMPASDTTSLNAFRSGLSHEELGQLLVNHRNGKKEFFCDLGVYTKNRNFRLFLSSKLGKNNPLIIARINEFQPEGVLSTKLTPSKRRKISSDEGTFLSSLVSHVEYSGEMRFLECETSEGRSSQDVLALGGQAPCSNHEADSGYQSSPYPEVDAFVRSVMNQGGVQGEIWRWAYFSHSGMIVYDIVKNRWCENIGRPHKSNNIIIVVDLKKEIYYQKCHDNDCRAVNFRSPEHSLPRVLLEALQQRANSWDSSARTSNEDDIDDEDLIHACISLEQSEHNENMNPEDMQNDSVTDYEHNEKVNPEEMQNDNVMDYELLMAAAAVENST